METEGGKNIKTTKAFLEDFYMPSAKKDLSSVGRKIRFPSQKKGDFSFTLILKNKKSILL